MGSMHSLRSAMARLLMWDRVSSPMRDRRAVASRPELEPVTGAAAHSSAFDFTVFRSTR